MGGGGKTVQATFSAFWKESGLPEKCELEREDAEIHVSLTSSIKADKYLVFVLYNWSFSLSVTVTLATEVFERIKAWKVRTKAGHENLPP